ncbi:MAG: hypothetical protein RIB86_05550, partial [Imperialibacter sp.]
LVVVDDGQKSDIIAKEVDIAFVVFPDVGKKVGIEAFVVECLPPNGGKAADVVFFKDLAIDFKLFVDLEVKLLAFQFFFILVDRFTLHRAIYFVDPAFYSASAHRACPHISILYV